MKLQVENLNFSFNGELILKDLNVGIKEGEFVTILGPSGCGKSTLLNILAGVLKADNGSILVDSEPVDGLSSHFAYMPQQDLLLPWKTIIDNVTLYGKIHKKGKAFKEEALSNFETFGIAGYENRYPNELSGGMRQRAAFLRTALCEADILLLDEPFGALDVITRGEMQDWLLALRNAFSRTTILVTHDVTEAIYLSDRVLLLSGQPAVIKKEFIISESNRSKEWLFMQSELEIEIYRCLKKENQ